MTKTIHHGHNVKRFREMLGIKQEAFAHSMGEDWNQKRVSLLEAKEVINDTLLEQVAALLKIPTEAIKNFDEEAAINIITSTFNDSAAVIHNNSTFNQVDKFIEALDENKKLYIALLKEKDEKIALLQSIIDRKK